MVFRFDIRLFLVLFSLLFSTNISLETKRGGSLSSGPPLGGMTLAQADRQTTAIENIIFVKLGFAGSTFFFLFKLLCCVHTMLIV